MKAVRNIVLFLFIALSISIAWAVWRGNGWLELDTLLNYPWFIMSLVDVYAGFILFCLWVWFRESSILWSLVVTLAMMLLGNLFACLYVLLQLRLSRGDWNKFWLGVRAGRI